MNKSRWFVTSAILVAAIYAIGQGTNSSTSNSQSKNGGASASASSSSSVRSGGSQQAGSLFTPGQSGRNNLASTARPTHVVMYRFENRSAANNNVVRQIEPALIEQQNQFWNRLANAGKLVMAGYWRERDGAMAVLSVQNDREAMQLVQSDPTVKQGAAFEIRAYNATVLNLVGGPDIGSNTQHDSQNSGGSQDSSNSNNSSQRSTGGN